MGSALAGGDFGVRQVLKSGRPNAFCARVQQVRLLREAVLLSALACLAAGLGWLAATWRPVPTLAALDSIAPSPSPQFDSARFASAQLQPAPPVDASSNAVRTFNGRPVRPVGTMTMIVTAYSPDARSCGIFADGVTASGYSVWTNGMKLAAADTSLLPMGSLISVPGYDGGNIVPVLDRGGAIKGNRLDMLYPTHRQALRWGVQKLRVTVWEYADNRAE